MATFAVLVPIHFSTITTTRVSPPNKKSMGGRRFSQVVPCMAVSKPRDDKTIVRRSADYHPPIWEYDYLQSLKITNYEGDTYKRRADKLKEDVRMMLNKVEEPLYKLELVDTVQRLGISYHFRHEIKMILEGIYNDRHSSDKWSKEDLYATSLKFRLLRQHGFVVPQDVFDRFKDEYGKFMDYICKDTKGMLYLYEASYLSVSGESILDEARDFTTKHLKKNKLDGNDMVALLVTHALELPLHWRMQRLEARWFIDVYERTPDVNTTLLELAKFDFNFVQSIHQKDLKHMSRWWKNIGLGEKLNFARDRVMENFFWTVGVSFEPQFQYLRRMITKINSLITTIDDVYDVYGTLDELELFTDAIERWDINAMEELPQYMKICFLALYNSINEMAYDALKEKNSNVIVYLKNVWINLCKSYLQEAKWYYNGYTPTLEEYNENAWISIGAPTVLLHSYIFVTNPITIDALECLEKYQNLIRWSSMILRLSDDLGTSQDEIKRGDNPKSIQCYMREMGASEEEAREHIRYLISETWKKMNEYLFVQSPFNQAFINVAMNLARMSQCMYEHGDGHGIENHETRDRVLSLIIEPINLV